jgi:hypothetical protein
MGQPFNLFDIFKVSEDGSLSWVDTAPTLEATHSLLNGLQANSGAKYIAINQQDRLPLLGSHDS